MKRAFLALFALVTTATAELPVLTDETKWLGYFVGWTEKKYDYGFGGDGEGLVHIKKGKKRISHRSVKMHYVIQEEVKGKWVNRKPIKEGGLTSESPATLDSKKPISVLVTVTGGTQVEFIQAKVKGMIVVKPKLVEKKTENPIRVGLKMSLPSLHRIKDGIEKKELKKKMGSDQFTAKRIKDGKKIRVKFIETDIKLDDKQYLAEGASEFAVKSRGLGGKTFVAEQPKPEVGRIDISNRGPLYKGFSAYWWADSEKLGTKNCYITFGVE